MSHAETNWPRWAEADLSRVKRVTEHALAERGLLVAAYVFVILEPSESVEDDERADQAMDELFDAGRRLKALGGPR